MIAYYYAVLTLGAGVGAAGAVGAAGVGALRVWGLTRKPFCDKLLKFVKSIDNNYKGVKVLGSLA